MFENVDVYPGDPILTLNDDFRADPRTGKVNLSIGVYLDASGNIPAMRAVLDAEAALAAEPGPRPYLPMEGCGVYRELVRALVFGPSIDTDRVAVVQTLGGSGALKVGGDFVARYFPRARVWVSDPAWNNYYGLFEGAGIEVREYRYFDDVQGQVDFPGMLAAMEAIPRGDVVLLQPCCHNPTGADLTEQQWREVACVIEARGLLAFFDMAYQGFGRGLDEDAFAIRHFAAKGIPMLVATSFSKNFSLYGERCGSLGVVCSDAPMAMRVLGQLKATIRRIYSSPPGHGSRIIRRVLEDEGASLAWRCELETMRWRIQRTRLGLYRAVRERCPSVDFSFLIRQAGMFSYSSLLAEQAVRLREQSGIYVLDSGRICLAALTEPTIAPVADAFARVLGPHRPGHAARASVTPQ